MPKPLIRIGHSPDPDDAFMFYALAKNKIDPRGLRIVHVIEDIESLNQRAFRAELEVTALSAFSYFQVSDKYALLTSGASVGDRYGPMVVARDSIYPKELKGKRIAIPGKNTTAQFVLRLVEPDFEGVLTPFDKILEVVNSGEVEAGLVIHEGQLTYKDAGLKKIIDLGEWFFEMTKLPLPLGLDAVRKNLGEPMMRKISSLLKESIEYALDHRKEALEYAMKFGRGISTDTADEFVGMYVNDETVEMSRKAKEALKILLEEGKKNKLLPQDARLEFVRP